MKTTEHHVQEPKLFCWKPVAIDRVLQLIHTQELLFDLNLENWSQQRPL